MTTDRNLSTQIAAHVAGTRFEDLPTSTVLATKRALLDGIGVMLAASGLSADIKPFVKLVRAMGGAPQASVLGSWERVPAATAALANGAMAHALDYEDAFDAAPVHPNASLIPAALAVAQEVGADGKALIAAVATGCDLVCRLALGVGDALENAWYPPPILGAFGAVAATAKLRGLTAEQTRDAFSLLMCQNVCPQEIKFSRDSVIRAVREAFPAQAAVLSARLAVEGVRGFESPLEGRGGFFHAFAQDRFDAKPLFERLGQHFYIEDLSFKPWPCCRGTHPYIEAVQQLRAAHEFASDDIKLIRAFVGPVQQMLCEPLARKRAPTTAIDAKFSLPFTIALAFVDDEVTLDSFADGALSNRRVLELASRVEAMLRASAPTSGAVSIELHDGRSFDCEIHEALGHPSRPLDDARLRAKFIDCAMRASAPFARSEAEELCERILALDHAASVDAGLALPRSQKILSAG